MTATVQTTDVVERLWTKARELRELALDEPVPRTRARFDEQRQRMESLAAALHFARQQNDGLARRHESACVLLEAERQSVSRLRGDADTLAAMPPPPTWQEEEARQRRVSLLREAADALEHGSPDSVTPAPESLVGRALIEAGVAADAYRPLVWLTPDVETRRVELADSSRTLAALLADAERALTT